MIGKRVEAVNSYKLTRPEALAFVRFLLMEEKRHNEDIRNIRAMVKYIRKQHGIEGSELNTIYSEVYSANSIGDD